MSASPPVCLGLRGELMAFYSEWERSHPDESLTRLSDLRPKMLGTREHKRLKVKAAESYGLAHFCVHMLQKHSARIGGEAAVAAECAETMLRYVRVAKASGVTLPSAAHEDAPSLAPQHFERHDRFSHDLLSDQSETVVPPPQELTALWCRHLVLAKALGL